MRLAGDSPSQERLSSARRTDDENAARDSQPGLGPTLGRAEIVDDVAEQFDGGAIAADVGEFRLVGLGDRPSL